MMFTVFYHLYFNRPVKVVTFNQVDKVNGLTVSANDSILKIYTAISKEPIRAFDSSLNNADSLKAILNAKLAAYNKLKIEISAVINDSGTYNNLKNASQKMIGLQQQLAELRYKNKNAEKVNKRLDAMVDYVSNKDPDQTISQEGIESTPGIKNGSKKNVFILSDLHFSALQINADKEQTALKADETEKLSVYFKIKSVNIQSNNSEIVIVILQPDGKVLQDSDWDTGTFESVEGKKIYSRKLKFFYVTGELKQLNFSLAPDNLLRGIYTVKVYHNGILIGKTDKILS